MAVERAFTTVEMGMESLSKDLQSSLVMIKLAAEDLERASSGCDQVKSLDAVMLDLIGVVDEFDRRKAAMQRLKQRYEFDPERPTDFKELIQAEMENIPAALVDDNAFYKQFQEAVWNVHHAGIPMPGQEQGDIMCTTQAGLVNKTCPLSGKPVTEIQDPVRGGCGHIYERDAVMSYIGRRRDQQCAAAGCPRKITIQDMTCDAALRMEIEELRLRGESHTRVENLQEDEDILDVE